MITLYLFIISYLVLILWLIYRKRWKVLLWVTGIFVIFVLAPLFLYYYLFLKNLGTECFDNQIWEIEEYQIIEKRCVGFAGPQFYSVYLYKNDEKIYEFQGSILDSVCVIEFKPESGKKLIFDICEKKLK